MEEFLASIYFYDIIAMLAGVGAFMVGMKLMSDSMEKLADNRMRKLFGKISSNRFIGVGIGAAATVIIQSSSATTVMVVGFVNAGVMSLFQATAIIMGANIGTTITAQLASLQAFSITEIATLFTFIGVFITLVVKSDKKKTIGFILAGIGLLFLGLEYMSASMTQLKDSPFFSEVVANMTNPFLLLAVGIVFTAAIQSSSAVTGILVTMATGGVIIGGGGNAVLYIILGSNIGTCATALLSMVGARSNAKRAAIIHLLFNVIGVVIFFVLLVLWPSFMDVTFAKWFAGVPATQIAMFHTFFNITSTLIMLPFMSVLVKLATLIIKDEETPEKIRLRYIDDRLLQTPAVAVAQLIKEIGNMARISENGLEMSFNAFLAKDVDKAPEVIKIKDDVEFLTQAITKFLVSVAAIDLSYADEMTVSSLYHVVSDIERISDFSYNITRYTETSVNSNLNFSELVKVELAEMYTKIKLLFRDALYTFEKRYKGMLPEIEKRENEIDAMKKQMVDGHIKRLNDGECNAASSSVFVNLVGNLERVGDHLTYIARSIISVDEPKKSVKNRAK